MNRTCILLSILTFVACGKTAPLDTVDSLVADPERLKAVMQQCREVHAKTGDALCNAASEAFRRRFIGNGKGQYTPQP